MFKCNENVFICSEQDLKDMWFQAWVLSKGLDKGEGLEVDFREKMFKEYLEKKQEILQVEEKPVANQVKILPFVQPNINVVYGDPIEGKVVENQDIENHDSEDSKDEGKTE